MHEVDPREKIRKTPTGYFSLGLLSKVMIILLECQPNADEGTDATVKSVLSSNPVCQIDPSEV